MKIVVLVKQVPDTETNIKVGDKAINESGVKWITSPYDEFAIEEGIRIREKSGGEVIAVSLGPDRVIEALRNAYAMGVDRAVHIKVDDYVTFDSTYTSELIANFIKSENADIVLGGRQSIDTDSSQVVLQVAERLGIAHIAMALEITIADKTVTAKREIEGGTEVIETLLPVAVTAQKGLNEPRYPSLKGIMSAKKKPIETKKAEELGATASKLEVVSLEPPPPRIAGRKLEAADAQSYASQLVKALREEAKVI